MLLLHYLESQNITTILYDNEGLAYDESEVSSSFFKFSSLLYYYIDQDAQSGVAQDFKIIFCLVECREGFFHAAVSSAFMNLWHFEYNYSANFMCKKKTAINL